MLLVLQLKKVEREVLFCFSVDDILIILLESVLIFSQFVLLTLRASRPPVIDRVYTAIIIMARHTFLRNQERLSLLPNLVFCPFSRN